MNGNPFYVDPFGGYGKEIVQGLSGLGSVLGQRQEEKRKQEQEAVLMQEAQDVFASNDPVRISQFYIKAPEFAQRVQGAVAYKNKATEQNMIESMQRILAGEDPRQVITERAQFVQSQGGDPIDTLQELDVYQKNPEGYRAVVENALIQRYPDVAIKMRQAQSAGQQELTGTQKDYAAAKREGFEGNFVEYQKALKGGPDSDVRTMMLQAQLLDLQDRMGERQSKADKAQEAEKNKIRSITQTVDSVLTEVGLAKDLAKEGTLSTGIGAAVTEGIPGSPAYNLRKTVDTVKANLGFDKLQQMREASPTGGALGSVTERELDLLQATIANLDPKMGDDELLRNLEKVERHYNNWKKAVTGGGVAAPSQSGFSESDIATAAKKVGMSPEQFRKEMGL